MTSYYSIYFSTLNTELPRWLSSKESACNAGDAGDTGSIPGSRRCPGGGHGNSLLYSCLKNLMDRGAWWATVRGIAIVGHDLVTKPPLCARYSVKGQEY